MKICSRCKESKLESEFYKDCSAPSGLSYNCKKCIRNNIDTRQYQKDYRKSHKEQGAIARYKNENTLKRRFGKYEYSAKRKNRIFNLTMEQFNAITSNVCFYCGLFTKNKNFTGIDRIDSNIGYLIENCVPCCSDCNEMKNDRTIEEFLNHIKDINKFQELSMDLVK